MDDLPRPPGARSDDEPQRGQVTGLLSPWLQRRRFSAVRPWLRGARILDYGCGPADLAAWIPAGAEYVGVERDPVVAAAARARRPSAEILTGCVEDTPRLLDRFAARPFDCVVLAAVIEHLRRPDEALRRLAAVLTAGGRLIVTTPAPAGRLVLAAGSASGITSRAAHEEHETLLSRGRLCALVSGAGLEVERHQRLLLGMNQLLVARAARGL